MWFDVLRYLWLSSQWCHWLSICSWSISISAYRYLIWCDVVFCFVTSCNVMMWLDVTVSLQLHDVEYYVDYQTSTYLLLYLSISANTPTGWWQGSKNCQPCRTSWGSETASRQRRRHWSFFWCKLHHHGIILCIVHNWIGYCVNTALQWSRHYDGNNYRSGSSCSSRSSGDHEYSRIVLLMSLLGRPATKCRQHDDNIAQQITVQHGSVLCSTIQYCHCDCNLMLR